MNRESGDEIEKIEAESELQLRNMVFATDIHQGLQVFDKLFGEGSNVVSDEYIESEEMEWIQPSSEAEAQQLLKELEIFMEN